MQHQSNFRHLWRGFPGGLRVPERGYPRKRATKKAKKETGTTPIVEDDTAIKMMNQEEYVQPVDGGDIETVEEDEHPEVLEATVEQKKRREVERRAAATSKRGLT